MKHSEPLERATAATAARERRETWDDQQFREARERDLRQRTADARSAVTAVVSCLLLAALLTSGKLVEIAQRQELGTARDRQLAVAEGVDRVANFLSLNRPYDFIRDIRGAGTSAADQIDTIDEVAADLDLGVADTADAPETVAPETLAPAVSLPTTTTTTTTMPPGPLRIVGDDSPLTVFVGGDSQAEYLAQAITTESGLPLDVKVQPRISTSLARPDYFNWPARLVEVDADQNPEAVVFFIGANDYQDMADIEGDRLVQGSAEWQAEWTRRLEITLDLLEREGRHVFWVTQPPMRDGRLDDGIQLINDLAAPVIAERDFVTAIEIWELFGGEAGFAERLTGPDGVETRARIDDGVHLSRTAASWVADIVFAAMADVWEFESG
jgi:uncharacterized protein